jgi:tripartite-type tricarboxylate transporter receptor subunit TctC
MYFKLAAAGLTLLAALAVPDRASHAQAWPTKPVKVIVPFAAGGSTDRVGRVVADELSKTFKQQFYVENRVGGGGAVGAREIVRVEPDGYTLLIGGFGPLILGPAAGPLGYDPIGDFTHVAMIAGESYVFAAHASTGLKTIADLTAMLKSRSQPVNVGSPGVGTLGQLMVEQFRLRDEMKLLNHVPYRGGGAQMTTDLLGGHVPLAMSPIALVTEHIKAGTVVALAASSDKRMPILPNVPTFREAGYEEVGGAIWFWVAGPKNLPEPIVSQLNKEVRRIIASPEIQAQFNRDALLSADLDAPALNRFVASELKRWSTLIEKAGLKKN